MNSRGSKIGMLFGLYSQCSTKEFSEYNRETLHTSHCWSVDTMEDLERVELAEVCLWESLFPYYDFANCAVQRLQ